MKIGGPKTGKREVEPRVAKKPIAPTKTSATTATTAPASVDDDAADDAIAAAAPFARASTRGTAEAQAAHQAELRKYFVDVQREQWTYYADNMGPATNFLPPDNVRVEQGKPIVVDYRTSPTNVGLAMLSTVLAQKLDYIGEAEMLQRLRDTVATIKKLPKWEGTVVDAKGVEHQVEHLYNWYSINGEPKEIGAGFISAVDNGNFVAFLVAIIKGLGARDPALSADLQGMVDKMRFDVFFDAKAGLLHHGGHVGVDGKLNMTAGHYDMLITEARCAYATGIMLGQLPPTAWTNLKPKLDKEIDGLQNNPSLQFQSYTGTMFEYLTPRLLMRHEGTPLGKADEQAVHIQMSERAGDMWGKSEAMSTTSQGYAAFGARGLSQSREFLPAGLDVIAPYASQMATGIAPDQVKKNLERMTEHGLRGKYGFYESATVRKRANSGGKVDVEVTPQFYAHHIGMGLVATANHLLGDVVPEWFHAADRGDVLPGLLNTPVSAYQKPASKRPKEAVVSNAYAYERQVTYDKAEIIGAGALVSHVKKIGGSTWAAQAYALANNEMFWLRDQATGKALPIDLDKPDRVVTTPSGARRFEYDAGTSGIGASIEVSVSAANRVKISKLELINHSGKDIDVAVTGYLDWVMDDINAYLNHPVYRNLYVETELDDDTGAVVARRRTMQGADQARQPFGFFAIAGGGVERADSSRTNILGRLGSLASPGDTTSPPVFGATLDPAAALTKSVKVKSGAKGEIAFLFGASEDRGAISDIVAAATAELKSGKVEPGVPHYPPDTAHAQMNDLALRRERGLRLTAGRVARAPLDPTGNTPAHRFEDGGRKVVVTDPFGTKKPWSMVVSNGDFGFVATAGGWAYSFGINSQQNRITPYVPDNTTELPLRGVVVKDKRTGKSFSIAPNPQPDANGKYEVEMSPGSITYRYTSDDGLKLSMTQSVASKDPCELWRVDIENAGTEERELELASFLKWALGASYPRTESLTKVSFDAKRGAVFAESPDSIVPGSVAFHSLVTDGSSVAQARDLFGTATDPFSGVGLDVKVGRGDKKSLSFILGQAPSKAEAERLLDKYSTPSVVRAEQVAGIAAVTRRLDVTQVKTPDAGFDTMINTWLPYQAHDAHFQARSGYYQSGGAYGFRDQLQSVMNLLDTGDPFHAGVARKHIIESARHQFEKGDVQHWWHPHNNLGQRSTITDNLLWLPLSIAHYLEVTKDSSLLDEQAAFVVGRDLKDGELDYCEPMKFSENTASVYEHAKRAIELVLTRIGKHGLPLIGKGDWNDGLDRVGHLGKGESVWLAFFLYDVLEKFSGVADKRGDTATSARYRAAAQTLRANIEKSAFDEQRGHYVRAWADDGETIDFNDVIVQAWAVLSGAADQERAVQSVGRAVRDLYDPESNTILLFDRPLDKETWGGSLAAYPNGLRENNAQYTHGSSWLPRAVAKLGDGDMAMKLFHALLPTKHADDPRYGAEPYVVAADIYGGKKAGEGGWSWYSGGPGWIYRTGVEMILGVQFRDADKLLINPTIPRDWPGFEVTHKRGASDWTIDVKNPDGVSRGVKSVRVDGRAIDPSVVASGGAGIELIDDGKPHRIEVVLGETSSAPDFVLPVK